METRGKIRTLRTVVGAKNQAGTPLARSIAPEVLEELEEPIGELVEDEVAEQLEDKQAALAIGTLEVDLPFGRKGGTFIVDGTFTTSQIGAPVIITQAAPERFDECEGGIVLAVAEVLDRRRLKVGWFAAHGAPARVRFHFLVGAVE